MDTDIERLLREYVEHEDRKKLIEIIESLSRDIEKLNKRITRFVDHTDYRLAEVEKRNEDTGRHMLDAVKISNQALGRSGRGSLRPIHRQEIIRRVVYTLIAALVAFLFALLGRITK